MRTLICCANMCVCVVLLARLICASLALITHTTQGQWSIGIYKGTSPFSLKPLEDLYSSSDAQQLQTSIAGFTVANPTYTCAHVTDVPASFVADPFLWPMQVCAVCAVCVCVLVLQTHESLVANAHIHTHTQTAGREWPAVHVLRGQIAAQEAGEWKLLLFKAIESVLSTL